MKNLRKMALVIVALSFVATFSQAKGSDLDFQCNEEKNSIACIKAITHKAVMKKQKIWNNSRVDELKRNRKIVKLFTDAFKETSQYCQKENKFLFFSDKKANKINGKACQYAISSYISYITWSIDGHGKLLDVNGLLKVAETGCSMNNVQSCLFLFDVYHPRYTTQLEPRIKKIINQLISPNLKKAVDYYQKGCSKENEPKKNWFKIHEV